MSAIGRALEKFTRKVQITDLADQLFADGVCGNLVSSSTDLAQHIRRMEQGERCPFDDELKTIFIECCAERLSGGRAPRKRLIQRKLTRAILKDAADDL